MTACAHQPVISPDPQSPNHELVTCSACGLSRRRVKDMPIFEQQGAAIAPEDITTPSGEVMTPKALKTLAIENTPLNGSGAE